MAAGGSPAVDRVAKKGPQVSHVPDTEPYPAKLGDPTGKFEQTDPRKARGGKRAAMSKHGGSPTQASGQAKTESFAAMRGHLDHSAQFAQLSGNSPVRSPGRKTRASDARKLSTAGS